MKWIVFALLALGAVLPVAASAQEMVPINPVPVVNEKNQSLWGIGGHSIIMVKRSDGDLTPVMRTEVYDARTVEILSRTQAPPLRPSDIRVMSKKGRDMIVVRRYLLIEVKPQDAQAEGISTSSLAQKWAASVRQALPAIAPQPSRFGI